MKKNKGKTYVFDIEANGFYFQADKVWVVDFYCVETQERIKVHPFKDKEAKKKIIDFVFESSYPTVVGHNILSYDIPVMRKIMGISYEVGKRGSDWWDEKPMEFLDTYYMSMFLQPDRPAHSIEYFGKKLGKEEKIDYRQYLIDKGKLKKNAKKGEEFLFYDKGMDTYCERDVDVGTNVLHYLFSEWEEMYKEPYSKPSYYRMGQKAWALLCMQEICGFYFDVKAAKKLLYDIHKEMKRLEENVEPKLPPRKPNKGEQKKWTMPKKPRKKDGFLAKSMMNWAEKNNAEILSTKEVKIQGKVYPIESQYEVPVKLPMTIGNQKDIKEWLMKEGWKPTFWNFRENKETGEKERTSPKLQEAGEICPNLLSMDTGIVKDICKYLSCRNRASVIEGWLENERIGMDDRLPAGASGLATSHRRRHRVVANIPSADPDVLYGKEIRDLFTHEKGNALVLIDFSALENRNLGHYSYKYDEGETAERLLEGDPHLEFAKALFKDKFVEMGKDLDNLDKHDPDVSPLRGIAKMANYAIAYGAGAAKVGSIAGKSSKEGKRIIDTYWEVNWGTAMLRDNINRYMRLRGQGKYLPAIDGRILISRSERSSLNLVIQSSGAICLETALCMFDKIMGKVYWDELGRPFYKYKGYPVKRVVEIHDEAAFECPIEIAQEVFEIGKKCFKKAGEYYEMNIPLEGSGGVAETWAEH